MKLKELHIRNIASIERADIDFEKDLNDGITGSPASIFLISGDTGAGKSVVLDSISMALYKKTPRIADVANATKNDYTDTEGEQMRVASIEQYTRLGISNKDESYSEVVFEGNDGRTYHARLTLGMKLGTKDKETGIRPLKHGKPTWEIRIDNGDWTKDSVEQTIHDAVGLDFQQFGRMAMLAQGQFANFLTGDKKEREAILEQLTNTQHFTAYGEAISSLWKKAKDNQTQIQTRYDTEKPHTLSDEEVEQLTKEQLEDQQRKDSLDKQIKAQEERLKLVELVLRNESVQEEARRKLQELETVIAGETYQQSKSLFTDWDNTTSQRHLLADLRKAKEEAQKAKENLQLSQNTFLWLSADIVDRQAKLKALGDEIRQTQAWIDERKQYDSLFSKAGEIDLMIAQYLANVKKAGDIETQLKQDKSKTEYLLKAEEEATLHAKEADKAVKEKETEIETLSNKRIALNPKAINDQISQQESARRTLEDIRKAYDLLEKSMKDADTLRTEIKADKERLTSLKDTCDKAEATYKVRSVEAETAAKRLTTMQMSVNDTIVALRHRLHDEHTETCPLCGGQIDHTHLDDDFNGILMPLEEEQKKAAEALKLVTKQRDDAREAFAKFDGTLQGKVRQLDKADKQNAADKQALETNARERGLSLCRESSLSNPAPQIEEKLQQLDTAIARLKATWQEAEQLQGKINDLLKEKKPLDKAKMNAETAKTKAENEVKANSESISRQEKECQGLLSDCERLSAEINTLFAGYADDWQPSPVGNLARLIPPVRNLASLIPPAVDTIRKRLKDDAKAYTDQKKKLADDAAKYDKAQTLVNSLLQISNNILQSCPEWNITKETTPYPPNDQTTNSPNDQTTNPPNDQTTISAEWTLLLSKVTEHTSKLKDSKALITSASESLSAYYQESGKTEQQLLSLIAQEQQVAVARRFVSDTDSKLKSRHDAIADAQKQIDLAMKTLDISNRSQLPDRQQLEEEKVSTSSQRDEILSKMAQARNRLDTHLANIQRLKEIEAQLEEAKKRFARWDRLNRIFGGTKFRTLVQTYILRPLLNNANIYLEQITDRYRLTCSEDNEQLSILVLDRYNKNQVRSVTVLSGGERFMISLALSLALSSLNRPDMNVNILFIDEGFGTLDEKSLDSVMSTLEKLQEIAGQTNRRVGIISHREELEERIPVKIQVVKKGEGRSLIEVRNS